jgi:16S rRNA (uracil1498-N3)-methyltransferase
VLELADSLDLESSAARRGGSNPPFPTTARPVAAMGYAMHSFRVGHIVDGGTIVLEDAGQVHHLKDVLRLAAGDAVTVFDRGGAEYLCEIAVVSEQRATLRVTSRIMAEPTQAKLAIACALPKKGMDDIVDKLTQLGVDTIIPMRTDRVVVRMSDANALGRVERWRKLAESAAGQSRRARVPEVRPLAGIGDVISEADGYDLKLIPTLFGERMALSEALGVRRPVNVLVLIGPEGDFTDEEVAAARRRGFVPVSLGHQVMRVDTAAIAVAAYWRLSGFI